MDKRLDVILVERGFVTSREKAKLLIKTGNVFIDGKMCDKVSKLVSPDSNISVNEGEIKYVSRGGFKLEKAIQSFSLNLKGLYCMDVGASTGGFTDCMLQNGAKHVISVDVGTDQLDARLRNDPRVFSMEKTNIRNLTPGELINQPDFISIDVSFISLTKVFPAIYELLKNPGEVVALIKPQFEAGKSNIGKKGVIKDRNIHTRVIEDVLSMAVSVGFLVKGLTYSPIKGPEGNIEYLLFLKKEDSCSNMSIFNRDYIKGVVCESHRAL